LDYGYVGGSASGYFFIGPNPAAALGLNNAGAVVGWRWTAAGNHAFRMIKGGIEDLHPTYDITSSVADDINASLMVVGYRYFGGNSRAFVQSPNLSMTDLPGLCNGVYPNGSRAFAVDDNGNIVGGSLTCAGEYHATLWRVRILEQPPLVDHPPLPPEPPRDPCGGIPCN
jgi:probable HAF family extracellular repeat protein